MPSTSKKQAHFMAAVAHNPNFAAKVGVPQSVGQDFNEADKRKQKWMAYSVRRPRGRPRTSGLKGA